MIHLSLTVDALFLLVLNVWVWSNLRMWPKPVAQDSAQSFVPPVSLLIPARNEAMHIGACIHSARKQCYTHLEIAVLDDLSDDHTYSESLQAADGDQRVHVQKGVPLVNGSYGKPHACQQLADQARGDWLLFVDADTFLEPLCVARLVATARRRNSDVVTGFPKVVNNTLTGWLATSMMVFTIAVHLPVVLIERTRDARMVAGSGMVMLISREAYARIGGHATAAQHIVDDMALLRAAKAAGLRVSLIDLSMLASVRMYETRGQVWAGFSKNLYAGLGRSPALLFGVIVLYAYWYLYPIAVLLASLFWPASWDFYDRLFALYGSVVVWALGAVLKGQVDRRFGVPTRYSLCACLSASLLIGIALRSFWQDVRGQGYVWKGRRYS